MKPAERLKIPPTPMPEQDPAERIHNVMEVPLGYTPEMAMKEAQRCLQCKTPFCVEGCPVGIDIPGFIKALDPFQLTIVNTFKVAICPDRPVDGD